MSTVSLPHVLIVDDRDDQTAFKSELVAKNLASVTVRHPQEVDKGDLIRAELVLVDYQIDHWEQRDELEALALKPSDGLALASILRRAAHDSEKASPTAFAIHTGQIEKLAWPLPAEHREHALARMNNLEWVFKKAQLGEPDNRATQVGEIASAVLKLPKLWSSSGSVDRLDVLAELLDIRPDEKGRDQLIEDIEACLPPVHELSMWSHGLAVLRWLLHRILPYPCFLWDSFQLAARFTMDHRDLSAALKSGQALTKALKECEYSGILCLFAGTRWWRTRVELFLWEITGGRSGDSDVVAEAISKLAGRAIKRSEPSDHPIVCLNSNYQPLQDFASLAEAVRIRPDDWPPYADQAWATIEMVKSEPKMRALLLREEIERLEEKNG
ncbi:MAG: hypothetical protein JWN24_2872 [Phycisphaerales bacterium]|nr:hypothetical protein [Phycisphaerales bacterium]